VSLADASGTVHRRCDDRAKLRIVSLVPSLTELLCDLGLAQTIVGRTGYCIHPAAEVERIPKIGGTKTVNIEKIRGLAPTHLLVNIDENEKSTVEALSTFIPHIIVTHPQKPRENLGLYRLLGQIFAVDRDADRLCVRFEAAWSGLVNARESGAWPKQRVLYLIWKDPWMTIARHTYVGAMLSEIGWQQVDVRDAMDTEAKSSPRYPAIDVTRAAQSGVDRILLSSEPFHFGDNDFAFLERIGPPVQRVDGEMLSWYGSRAILGLEYLRSLASGTAD
jgi:ABC-type hemin transport system substrate-binding protein